MIGAGMIAVGMREAVRVSSAGENLASEGTTVSPAHAGNLKRPDRLVFSWKDRRRDHWHPAAEGWRDLQSQVGRWRRD